MKFLVLGVLLVPSAYSQSTIRVPSDAPTIQEAIEAAQDGDTVLVASGRYNETIDFRGKAITVASETGAATTMIDASGLFDTVVRFVNQEGRDSVLRGFTVTGGLGSLGGGILAMLGPGLEASPRIEACIVQGNRSQGSLAGGASGNMAMVDCTIEDNVAGGGIAGGIYGAARLVRCTVRNNLGYDAGGIYLHGAGRAVDCVITGNESVEGTRGGGACLAGAFTSLERCLIAGNRGASLGQYPVASAGVFIFSPSGAPLIRSCTITGNSVHSPYVPPGEDCGGVQGPAQLVNTIVYGNDGLQIGLSGGVRAAYCDIAGGHPGPGNIDVDPLFVDPSRGNYRLRPASRCIDAGVPLPAFDDPDATRADIGAFYFQQGNAVVRNGTGVNPLWLSSVTRPRIGTDWHLRIDSSRVSGASLSIVTLRTHALEPGILVPEGEILVAGAQILLAFVPSSRGADDLFLPIPNNVALLGRTVHVQGLIQVGRRLRLGNALEAHLGN